MDEPLISPPRGPRPVTRGRVIALLLAAGLLLALAYPGLSRAAPLSAPRVHTPAS
jgi:hypothetical protein